SSSGGGLRLPAVFVSCPESGGAAHTDRLRGALAASALREERVQAPSPAAAGGDEEEKEAEHHRQLAVVRDRPEAVGSVRLEVGDRHLAATQESHRHGEQAQ